MGVNNYAKKEKIVSMMDNGKLRSIDTYDNSNGVDLEKTYFKPNYDTVWLLAKGTRLDIDHIIEYSNKAGDSVVRLRAQDERRRISFSINATRLKITQQKCHICLREDNKRTCFPF